MVNCIRLFVRGGIKSDRGGHDWPGSFGNMTIDANTEIWNFISKFDINGLIGCNTTYHEEQSPFSVRRLIGVFDVLGRQIPELYNTPLLYIYDDGTVEKKINNRLTMSTYIIDAIRTPIGNFGGTLKV